jgi:prevent-host-death family protein
MDWQVQAAKQRFSELLRQAHDEGPQTITRHGEQVAVVVDIAWFREKTSDGPDLAAFLSEPGYFAGFTDALDAVVDERVSDLGREAADLFADSAEAGA